MTRRSVWAWHLVLAGTLGLVGGCTHTNVNADGQGGTSNTTGGNGGAGLSASGGAAPSSGGSGSGGAAVGGTAGSGGAKGSGGVPGAAGAPGLGGAMGSGGTTTPGTVVGNCPGSCTSSAPTSCSAPQVRVTQVSLGSALSYSTDETYNIPLAIAAKPGGGSLIAWMTGYSHYGSSTTSQVHIGELDCDDKLVGMPFTMEAHDFQDIAADGDGGVVVVTRDAQGGTDAQHCGDVNNLCVTPSDRPGCYDMHMVRFDCAGTPQWSAKLTTPTTSAPAYTSGSGSNDFVWWYQHQGRLAYDGTNYAAYFCNAITITNNACSAGAGKVDIHEGDRMQVVDPTGKVLTGHDSFGGGCSHSWTTHLVWDPRTKHFVMVCATDNSCRIAQPNPYRTIVSGTCDGTLFGGDVVNASTTGYWVTWSYQGQIKLEHFSTGASDKTVATAGTTQNPHLVAYGANRMLLTWKSGSGLAAQVYDAGTGDAVGSQFTIAVPDHPWQSFKPFPDGSVAWAGVGSASATIQIARVMPCSD